MARRLRTAGVLIKKRLAAQMHPSGRSP